MGTITTRTRADGSQAHTAQIRIKRDGKIIHTEAQTFERKPAARQWLEKREKELAKPGAVDGAKVKDPTLAETIDHYLSDSRRQPGKTKSQVLRSIKAHSIGQLRCSQITSQALVDFAKSLDAQPQTIANYISHLSSITAIARPAWGYPLDHQAMLDAKTVMKRLQITARSNHRNRRPTLEELNALMEHFSRQRRKRGDTIPMADVIAFCIFSTRRIDEVCRLTWADLDEQRSEVWVRDMKHPGEKIGNDVRTTLPSEALRIIQAQPRTDERIFPYVSKSASSAFTRAVSFLAIDDLNLHDLRHDGVSRLFEMGWTLPQAAQVSAHRTWNSLKRYTHLHQAGDKYAGWVWLDRIAPVALSA